MTDSSVVEVFILAAACGGRKSRSLYQSVMKAVFTQFQKLCTLPVKRRQYFRKQYCVSHKVDFRAATMTSTVIEDAKSTEKVGHKTCCCLLE
jgi:hypothetical protein